ncbi:MAG TPA: class I SAM-dependent methyltransferase [Syntrophorhabdales bacterium]|nr:class I SAM-dependent methyltransferase [Syntrophorhabdales bacterium]
MLTAEETSAKLNWGERLAVNTPLRVLQQYFEVSWMAKVCSARGFARALEVGCGRGAGARLIRKRFEPADLHVTDLDLEMMQKASTYLTEGELAGIHLCAADLLALPYPAGSMDAVFGFGVLHHIPDWLAALREVARVLHAGGFYFLEELYPTLYQNFVTRHILVHPRRNRFAGADLRFALEEVKLALIAEWEVRYVGILGVAQKIE